VLLGTRTVVTVNLGTMSEVVGGGVTRPRPAAGVAKINSCDVGTASAAVVVRATRPTLVVRATWAALIVGPTRCA
jgi:hypothetical protein